MPPRYRLLYVEDHPVNVVIMQELLRQRPDIELRCVGTGAEGLAELRAWRPQLLLLDLQLPDMTGQQVLRQVRADAASADLPCIALSANALADDEPSLRAAGFDEAWRKPLDFARFLHALQRRLPRQE